MGNNPKYAVKDRLNYAMNRLNIKAIDLSKRTGIPKGSISQYLNGYVNPKQDRIYLMAKALHVNEVWLMGYDVPIDRKEDPIEKSGLDFFRIPLFSSRICCGDGAFAEDDILEYIPVPSKGMSSPDDYFCQIASGDSMKDAGIEDGDILVFEKTSQVHNGMIGAFCIDENEAVCKKYKRIHNLIVLQPMNSDYEPIIIDPADENFRCVGKLKKSIKDFERE